jgi:hypothetical protein
LIYTLTTMSSDEAKTFGLAEDMRHFYVRVDKANVNIVPPTRQAKWFRLVGVPLGNQTALYPSGDTVQTVEPWTPPDTWVGISPVILNAALDDIDAGLANGQRYSDAGPAKDRAAWSVVARHCSGKSEGQCREIVRAWLKTGLLYSADYDDPIQRKRRPGLHVDASKRPSV